MSRKKKFQKSLHFHVTESVLSDGNYRGPGWLGSGTCCVIQEKRSIEYFLPWKQVAQGFKNQRNSHCLTSKTNTRNNKWRHPGCIVIKKKKKQGNSSHIVIQNIEMAAILHAVITKALLAVVVVGSVLQEIARSVLRCLGLPAVRRIDQDLLQWISVRAANNSPAGAGQIVRSHLFLLGHMPFLAGQTSITSYRYKSAPSPFTWCLNMKQVNFQSIYCTWASFSIQEKWNAWYSKISITFVRTTILSALRLIYGLLYYEWGLQSCNQSIFCEFLNPQERLDSSWIINLLCLVSIICTALLTCYSWGVVRFLFSFKPSFIKNHLFKIKNQKSVDLRVIITIWQLLVSLIKLKLNKVSSHQFCVPCGTILGVFVCMVYRNN